MSLPTLKYIILFGLVLGLGIAAASIWLYPQTQSLIDDNHNQISQILRDIKELEIRWNEAILKQRLRLEEIPINNVNPLILVADLETALADADATTGIGATSLWQQLNQYRSSANHKIQLVKEFAQQNLDFYAALEFLTTAIHDLIPVIAELEAAPQADLSTLTELSMQVQTLRETLLEFNLSPDANRTARLQQAIVDLKASQTQHVPQLQPALTAIINQAETALQQKPAADNAFAAIIALPTLAYLDTLQLSYEALYRRHFNRFSQYQIWLSIGLGIIVILFIILLLRGRSRARERTLQEMNERLEQRVSERTLQLSAAYEELKTSQSQLIQAEKMSALGRMVAGVTHEINTPLAYSRSNVVMVNEQMHEIVLLLDEGKKLIQLYNPVKPDDEAIAEQFDLVREQIEFLDSNDILAEITALLDGSKSGLDKISKLVNNLKNFSRLDRQDLGQINLNDNLDDALTIAQNSLKYKAKIVKNYNEIPPVLCSPSQINQVFLNLLINAAQAIPERGTITLSTTEKNDCVDVIIEDNGSGIAEDVLPNIFDPFFTTKPIGEGTGLGLAIAYQIVEQHAGKLTVNSSVGQGTRFILSLPCANKDTLIAAA